MLRTGGVGQGAGAARGRAQLTDGVSDVHLGRDGRGAGVARRVSLTLLHLLSANFEFLRSYGLDAVREGALLQLAELVVSGYTAALFYLLFKLCERVLVDWACTARAGTPATPPAAAPGVSAPPPVSAEAPATPAASPPSP